MIITRTPFRVSFFGGGTDNKEWFERHGATILTSSIDRYCYLTARFLPPFFTHKHRIVHSQVELPSEVEAIQHPGVRACLQHLGIREGMEVHHNGDLPARSGLGSSSAFTVGMLHALHGLRRAIRSKRELADEAVHIEQTVLREVVGMQDQIQCAFGGLNMIEIDRAGGYAVRPVPVARERIGELQAHLLLFYTGIARYSSEIAAQTVAMIREGARDDALLVMASMAVPALSHMQAGRWQDFGELLDYSWSLKRRLSPLVTSAAIEDIYARAQAAGAVGGKLLGAGGGGFMLFLVSPTKQAAVRAALAGLVEIPVRFEFEGSRVIYLEP